MQHINFVVGTSTMKHLNNWIILKSRLYKSFKKCSSFIERKQFRHSRKSIWLALLQSFRTSLSNFRSLSIVIPRNLTSLLSHIKSFLIFAHTCSRNYQMAFICVQFYIIIFKPTYSNHGFFLK